jgi:cysteine desulfurase/selenocysteine lyase
MSGDAAALRIQQVRAAFPYLARCTYLNTASTGIAWPGQADAVAELYRVDQAEGYNGMPRWHARADACRERIGALLNVPAADVEFTRSTTEGLNLLALAIPLAVGERVVFAADEFPSVALPWGGRASGGAEVVRVPVDDETRRTDALVAAVERGARVLVVSHVHWRTGTRADLARLSRVCRAADCWLIVDGAHGVGAVPVDASLVDAYCAPTFKWLLSGFGLGFIAVSARLRASLVPRVIGYGNEPPDRGLSHSHVNYPGIYALHATLGELARIGWPAIHARVAILTDALHARLIERGFAIVTPASARAGIVAVRHAASATLVPALAARGIHVEDRDGLIRVAPHFYNTVEDLDAFVSALTELAASGGGE